MNKEKILVAMSGGVDSSVTAALLKEAGHEILGVSMALYDGCDDFADAKAVADRLGFDHVVVDLSERFETEVVSPFVESYLTGQTPNPCIRCNRAMKFSALWDFGSENGCDAMATGHYAQIAPHEGGLGLFAGIDPTRDQTYFLFLLNQPLLARIRFPLGMLNKAKVWEKAKALDLAAAHRPESREVCFVPEDDYLTFVESRAPGLIRPGNIVDLDGKILGQHEGVHRYTIGQRKGLGIGWTEPLYVLEIRPDTAEVVVGANDGLYAPGLVAGSMNWIFGAPPKDGQKALVKIRYNHPGVMATLHPAKGEKCEIRFDKPVRAIAPGQAAVAYDGDRVIGGGWIEGALV